MNPRFLVCDSDALIQIFLSESTGLLRDLNKNFGVQPVIVTEVEGELSWNGAHKNRFAGDLQKALTSKVLRILDSKIFKAELNQQGRSSEEFAQYRATGTQYDGPVQRGEAYSHSAGIVLGVPVMSNDGSAIETLLASNLPTACPVLRYFDLLVFSYLTGHIDLVGCERIRKKLMSDKREQRSVPIIFRNQSFESALTKFTCRLEEFVAVSDRVVYSIAAAAQSHKDVLRISRTS